MPIESKIPSEEINIKDLSINETEQTADLEFDPKKEITEADIQEILKLVQEYGVNNVVQFYRLSKTIYNLSIIRPNLLTRVSSIIDPDIKEFMLDSAAELFETPENQQSASTFHNALLQAVTAKLLFPETIPYLEAKKFNQEFLLKRFQKKVLEEPTETPFEGMEIAVLINILYPEANTQTLMERRHWESADAWSKQFKKMGINDPETLPFYAEYISYGRILSEKFYQQNEPTNEDWKLMKNSLNFFRKAGKYQPDSDGKDFPSLARSMTILSAKKFAITEEGLVLNSRESTLSNTTTIPEIKKF